MMRHTSQVESVQTWAQPLDLAPGHAGRAEGKPFILLPDLNVYLRHRTVLSATPGEYLLPVRFLGDAESSLGDDKSSLGDAKSSLGDV